MEIKSGPGTDYCYILNFLHHYRPQRSWGKVVFSQACVILFTGGGSALVHAGIPHPPPPSRHSPRTRHPPDQAPPLRSSRAYLEIRSTSWWYAACWNAILYFPNFAWADLRGRGCNLMQFWGKFGKILCWHPRRVCAPTSGKSWIGHCFV